MMISDVFSIVALFISLSSLYFTWRNWKKEKPIISHEFFSCQHHVSRDGKSTELSIELRFHNRGDRGTRLNQIEALATGSLGKEHRAQRDLSVDLEANKSTDKLSSFFSFIPPFQYNMEMPCTFILHHTHAKHNFTCLSKEAKDYLGMSISFEKRP